MEGCAGLIIAGGALQLFGFVLVAWELWRVQRREWGTPQSLIRVQASLRRLRELPRRVFRRSHETHVGSGRASGGGSISASGRAWLNIPGEGATVEQRLEVIEFNLVRLEREVSDHGRRIRVQRADLRSGLDGLRQHVEQQHTEREADRREFLRGSIVLQVVGTGCFVVGTVLGVIGSVA